MTLFVGLTGRLRRKVAQGRQCVVPGRDDGVSMSGIFHCGSVGMAFANVKRVRWVALSQEDPCSVRSFYASPEHHVLGGSS